MPTLNTFIYHYCSKTASKLTHFGCKNTRQKTQDLISTIGKSNWNYIHKRIDLKSLVLICHVKYKSYKKLFLTVLFIWNGNPFEKRYGIILHHTKSTLKCWKPTIIKYLTFQFQTYTYSFLWRIEFLCTSIWWYYRHIACTVFLVLKNRTVIIHHTVPGHDADIWSYARYCLGNIWSLLYRVSGITMHWKIRSLWLWKEGCHSSVWLETHILSGNFTNTSESQMKQ